MKVRYVHFELLCFQLFVLNVNAKTTKAKVGKWEHEQGISRNIYIKMRNIDTKKLNENIDLRCIYLTFSYKNLAVSGFRVNISTFRFFALISMQNEKKK
jgi:hypothetical protein